MNSTPLRMWKPLLIVCLASEVCIVAETVGCPITIMEKNTLQMNHAPEDPCVIPLFYYRGAGSIRLALDKKAEATDILTKEDITAIVDEMLAPSSVANKLRDIIDALKKNVTDLEKGCGSHCMAGQYVSQACTPTQKTKCEACPPGQHEGEGVACWVSCYPHNTSNVENKWLSLAHVKEDQCCFDSNR